MALYLVDEGRTLVKFEQGSPMVLSYPALPGSKLLSFRNDALQLLVKELVSEFFIIRYNVFQFFRNQALESISRQRGMHSRVMLQNDLQYLVRDLGNIHQKEGSVSLIWSEQAHCQAMFESSKDYKTLDIFISPALVMQLSQHFPEIGIDLQAQASKLVLPQPFIMAPAVRDIVTSILECPYDQRTSHFYFDLKVREYLYVLLEQHVRPGNNKYNFTPYDAGQVNKARELLLSDLSRPPLTIRELARKSGVSELKLRAGFKFYYNQGVFECFLQARMEKARELLLQSNKPIKEICTLTGYPHMTNFITAFRNYFGYTPGSLRRS